jgi:phytanoyl-CoA hydroxylase
MNAMDATRATKEELEQYEEQGFFCRHNVFSEEELEQMRVGVENIHAKVLVAAESDEAAPCELIDNQRFQSLLGSTIKWEWDENLQAVRSMEPCAHLDPFMNALIDDPRLSGPCRDIVGEEELSLFSDKLNVKRPGGAPFPWHQEGPYWVYGAEQLDKVVSVLTYLDEGTKENGCLWVIPGSHKGGALQGLKNRGVIGKLYTDVDLLDGEAYPVEVPAGSVLYFHYDLVHGSQGNHSQTNRRVFVTAFQPKGLRRWRLGNKIRNIQS